MHNIQLASIRYVRACGAHRCAGAIMQADEDSSKVVEKPSASKKPVCRYYISPRPKGKYSAMCLTCLVGDVGCIVWFWIPKGTFLS